MTYINKRKLKATMMKKFQLLLQNVVFTEKVMHKKQNKKRIENVKNPDINNCLLLKNVDRNESEEEISEALKNLGYEIESVQRFKNLPVVKVTLLSGEGVKKMLSDKTIYIGYRLASCELFDPYRRRPPRHFK